MKYGDIFRDNQSFISSFDVEVLCENCMCFFQDNTIDGRCKLNPKIRRKKISDFCFQFFPRGKREEP
jgi:hypothetical protein